MPPHFRINKDFVTDDLTWECGKLNRHKCVRKWFFRLNRTRIRFSDIFLLWLAPTVTSLLRKLAFYAMKQNWSPRPNHRPDYGNYATLRIAYCAFFQKELSRPHTDKVCTKKLLFIAKVPHSVVKMTRSAIGRARCRPLASLRRLPKFLPILLWHNEKTT